ncbi:MAG: VOC family protein [Vicinamibacteria bacterium]
MSTNGDKVFKPRRLGHANLWVEDLKRSEAFYHRTCGLTVEFWEPDLVATFLGTGNTPHDLGMIETTGGKARYGRNGLLQIPEGIGVSVGLGHLAWELANEVELVQGYRRAKSMGVPLDITVDHQVAHSVYLFDPDGNQMEYYCDTVKNWRTVLHGEMELITSGWDPEEGEPFSEPRFEVNPEIRMVKDAPIHPRRVTHAVLLTDELEGLARFYGTVGGLEEVHRDEGVVFLRGSMSNYPYHLVICQRGESEGRRYHHVSFELDGEEALAEAEASLRRQGTTPEHVVENEFKRSFFLGDPDGLLSEYYVRRSPGFPALRKAPPEERALQA